MSQQITGISPTTATFVGGIGSANEVIAQMTATMSPASPAFSGTWTINGADASNFVINSTTGVLSVGPNSLTKNSYNFDVVQQ